MAKSPFTDKRLCLSSKILQKNKKIVKPALKKCDFSGIWQFFLFSACKMGQNDPFFRRQLTLDRPPQAGGITNEMKTFRIGVRHLLF